MKAMIRTGFGGTSTKIIESIQSPEVIQNDGPNGIYSYPLGQYANTDMAGTDLCAIEADDPNFNYKAGVMANETVVAQTFNKELAREFGQEMGNYYSATLLHDDVVDESAMRRGKPSANIAFGNAASVLVGDFLYTRAFQLMVRTGNAEVLQVMADATNQVAAGEVMQLGNMHDPDVDETRYYRVIELKTAVLFSAGCKSAALYAGVDAEKVQALAEYGKKLGMAFQIMDDLLDYMGDAQTIGKALGDDLAEGKPTLPLIRAQSQLPAAQKARLRAIIEQGDRQAIDEVRDMLAQTDALPYSHQAALQLAEQAVACLAVFPDSPYRQALATLARMAAQRDA